MPESKRKQLEGQLVQDIEAVSLLDDPVRRKIYFCVPLVPAHADRDTVAAELGIQRNLAAFHLDKLAEHGLLGVTYRRVSGRTGRGAGRPRKLYQRPNEDKVFVSLPKRDYRLVAKLFATALESAGPRSHRKLAAAARESGIQLGKSTLVAAGATRSRRRGLAAVVDTLVNHGYDPYTEGKTILMRNCPFHALVLAHRDLVCGANQALIGGFVSTLESAGLVASYEPAENRCCVVLRPAVSRR